MKVFITTYNRIPEGLKLRYNFSEELMKYDLKEWLMEYLDSIEEISYQVNAINTALSFRGYSGVIEAEKNNIVYHIRFSS